MRKLSSKRPNGVLLFQTPFGSYFTQKAAFYTGVTFALSHQKTYGAVRDFASKTFVFETSEKKEAGVSLIFRETTITLGVNYEIQRILVNF